MKTQYPLRKLSANNGAFKINSISSSLNKNGLTCSAKNFSSSFVKLFNRDYHRQ